MRHESYSALQIEIEAGVAAVTLRQLPLKISFCGRAIKFGHQHAIQCGR